MLTKGDRIRRKFGLFFICVAVLMVIWGFTALEERLRGVAFLTYWLTCLVFVTISIYIALWDFWVMMTRERREQIEKLQEALKQDESTDS
ncbi:MAG: hypothetical protein ACPGVU_13060 [Limisphaerales bacterium]